MISYIVCDAIYIKLCGMMDELTHTEARGTKLEYFFHMFFYLTTVFVILNCDLE